MPAFSRRFPGGSRRRAGCGPPRSRPRSRCRCRWPKPVRALRQQTVVRPTDREYQSIHGQGDQRQHERQQHVVPQGADASRRATGGAWHASCRSPGTTNRSVRETGRAARRCAARDRRRRRRRCAAGQRDRGSDRSRWQPPHDGPVEVESAGRSDMLAHRSLVRCSRRRVSPSKSGGRLLVGRRQLHGDAPRQGRHRRSQRRRQDDVVQGPRRVASSRRRARWCARAASATCPRTRASTTPSRAAPPSPTCCPGVASTTS